MYVNCKLIDNMIYINQGRFLFLFHIRCVDLLNIRLVRLVFLLFEYNKHLARPSPLKNVWGGAKKICSRLITLC